MSYNPMPVLGQATMANSLPVAIASNQSAIAITIASGGVASGAIASGAIASGAVASGAIASGAFASGSISAGAIAAGATSIAENEDVASADGDRGVKILAVRKATPANTSGTDGDYEFLQMSAGRLWVDPSGVTLTVASHAVTNAGTFATQPAGSVAHDGVGTGVNPMLTGGYASAAAPTDVTADGDAVRGWFLRSGAQAVQPTFAGILATTGNGASGTGVQRVTIANDSTGILATVSTVTSLSQFAGQAIALNTGTRSAGTLRVTVATDDTVQVTGTLAHDAVDSGNPIKTGGQARTTNPTAVADADRTNFIADKLGKQVVVGSIRDLKANQVTTITASTSETTIVTAVASTFLDLYGLIITNTSATAVNVAIKDATAGTTRLNIAVPAGDTRGFMLPESGAIKQASVNNNWTATSSASVSSLVITALTVANI